MKLAEKLGDPKLGKMVFGHDDGSPLPSQTTPLPDLPEAPGDSTKSIEQDTVGHFGFFRGTGGLLGRP